MKETECIAEQLKLLCEGPSWLGTPIDVLLANFSQETASQRASHDAHTIWELVLHIESWFRIARVRLTASLRKHTLEIALVPKGETTS